MEKIYIGKVIGTHGIKGEIKILSDVEVKDKAFTPSNTLYFESDDKEYEIESVRVHKDAYLVLLKGFYNINDVLFLNKKKVYIDRNLVLNDDEYVLEELLGFEVYDENNDLIGIIKDYDLNTSYATFLVENNGKNIYIPNVSNYITNIDLSSKKVYTKNVGELML